MDKRKYLARPTSLATGQEMCGTNGVLTGEYVSLENAIRYMVNGRGIRGHEYNLYRWYVRDSGLPNWEFMGRIVNN